ncbi:hypothetical protein [Viridibacterium curvum]
MLVVAQRDALADEGVDLLGDLVVAHREAEDFSRLPRQVHHGEITFPGLAQPALARELLHIACAFTVRVTPAQHQPDVEQAQQDKRDKQDEGDADGLASDGLHEVFGHVRRLRWIRERCAV